MICESYGIYGVFYYTPYDAPGLCRIISCLNNQVEKLPQPGPNIDCLVAVSEATPPLLQYVSLQWFHLGRLGLHIRSQHASF